MDSLWQDLLVVWQFILGGTWEGFVTIVVIIFIFYFNVSYFTCVLLSKLPANDYGRQNEQEHADNGNMSLNHQLILLPAYVIFFEFHHNMFK